MHEMEAGKKAGEAINKHTISSKHKKIDVKTDTNS
jgi:hypothetical protein